MKTRVIAGALMVLMVLGSSAVPASAHVTIGPDTVTKGGYASLTFKVPNESPTASTTKVQIGFPSDRPFASVSVEPVPGWTYAVEKRRLDKPLDNEGEQIDEAVASITWTGTIKPGEFVRLTISVGPLPDDTDSLTFPTVQTYDDGDVVRWVDPVTAGKDEPEHPAPHVKLVAAAGEGAATASSTTASSTTAPSVTVAASSGAAASSDDVDQAQTLGVVGIALGGLALLVALGALVRRKASDAA